MSTIRTGLPATQPQTTTAPAARAASADFFRAALAQIQNEAGQAGSVQPAVTPIKAEPQGTGFEDQPLRPGSLLDIQV